MKIVTNEDGSTIRTSDHTPNISLESLTKPTTIKQPLLDDKDVTVDLCHFLDNGSTIEHCSLKAELTDLGIDVFEGDKSITLQLSSVPDLELKRFIVKLNQALEVRVTINSDSFGVFKITSFKTTRKTRDGWGCELVLGML